MTERSGKAPGAVDVTPWFAFTERPVRHGFYEFSFSKIKWHWDGRKWRCATGLTLILEPLGGKWRGLTRRAAKVRE